MPSLKIDFQVDDKGNIVIDKAIGNMGQLDQAARKASTGLEAMARKASEASGFVNGLGGMMGKLAGFTIAGLSISGLESMVKGVLESNEALQRNAEKAGVAASSMKLYQNAARLSGVSVDSLTSGLGILAKNMMGAAVDMGGAEKAFNALGISARDSSGQLKSTETMFAEVADKFTDMENGSNKTALAMALFGKGGKELIPILNKGGEGLADMKKDLEELGISFDDAAIKRAAEAKERFEMLDIAMGSIKSRAVSSMLPALETLSGALVKISKESHGFQVGVDALAFTMKALGSVVLGIAANFDIVGSAIGEVAARAYAAWHGMAQPPGNVWTNIESKIGSYAKMINSFWDKVDRKPGEKSDKSPGPLYDPKTNSHAVEEWAHIQRTLTAELEKTNVEASKWEKEIIEIDKKYADVMAKATGKNAIPVDTEFMDKWRTGMYANVEADRQKKITEILNKGVADEQEAQYAIVMQHLKSASEIYDIEKSNQLKIAQLKLQMGMGTERETLEMERDFQLAQLEQQRDIARRELEYMSDQPGYGRDDKKSIEEGNAVYDKLRKIEAQIEAAKHLFGTQISAKDWVAAQQTLESLKEVGAYYTQSADSQYAILTGLLERKAAALKVAGVNEVALEKWIQMEKEKAWIEAAKSSNSYLAGMSAGLLEYGRTASRVGDQMASATTRAFESMSDAMAEYVVNGTNNFSSMLNSIEKDLVKLLIQTQITGPLSSGLGKLLQGLTGSTSTSTLTSLSSALSTQIAERQSLVMIATEQTTTENLLQASYLAEIPVLNSLTESYYALAAAKEAAGASAAVSSWASFYNPSNYGTWSTGTGSAVAGTSAAKSALALPGRTLNIAGMMDQAKRAMAGLYLPELSERSPSSQEDWAAAFEEIRRSVRQSSAPDESVLRAVSRASSPPSRTEKPVVTVNVINNNGSEVSQTAKETPQGMEIDVVIDKAVAKKLGDKNSSSNKTLRSTFGARGKIIKR